MQLFCLYVNTRHQGNVCIFFHTYYKLIITTRLFFKVILKIFSLRKQ